MNMRIRSSLLFLCAAFAFAVVINIASTYLFGSLFFSNDKPTNTVVDHSSNHVDISTAGLHRLDTSITKITVQLTSMQKRLDKLENTSETTSHIAEQFSQLADNIDTLNLKFNKLDLSSNEYSTTGSNASDKTTDVSEQIILDETAQQQSQHVKQLDYIESKFLEEETDEIWSTNTSDLITSTINNLEGVQNDLTYVQCQTTLCMVEVQHLSSSAAQDFMLQFTNGVGSELPQASFHTSQEADGSSRMVIYLAREGHSLPQASRLN